MGTTKRLLCWFSAFLLLCLVFFLYQTGKERVEIESDEPQAEVNLQEKQIPVKERFSVIKMLDLSDSSEMDIIDANGDELIAGGLYLQSKSTFKLYPISDTLSIYQEADYALSIDNKEERSIKVRGDDGFFFIQGLTLLPEVGKEVVLDSFDHYQMVINY